MSFRGLRDAIEAATHIASSLANSRVPRRRLNNLVCKTNSLLWPMPKKFLKPREEGTYALFGAHCPHCVAGFHRMSNYKNGVLQMDNGVPLSLDTWRNKSI